MGGTALYVPTGLEHSTHTIITNASVAHKGKRERENELQRTHTMTHVLSRLHTNSRHAENQNGCVVREISISVSICIKLWR